MHKILIIEDDEILRENTSTFLKEEGFHVIEAKDGEEGLLSALENKIDLILCDISLPKLDGFGVYKKIEEYDLNIPFIFVTARVEKEDIRDGMQLGADDYITKPFRIEDLLKSINTRLAKREKIENEHQYELKKSAAVIDYLRKQVKDKNVKLENIKSLLKNVATLDIGLLKFINELLEENKSNIQKEIFDGADWLETFLGIPEALHTVIADLTTVVNLFLMLKIIKEEDLNVDDLKNTFFYSLIEKMYYNCDINENCLEKMLKYVSFETNKESSVIEF